MSVLRQMKQRELNLGPVADVVPSHSFETFIASHLSEGPTGQIRLMESICERSNMKRAVRRVIKNKGAVPRKNSVQPEIIGERVRIIFLPQIL